MMGRHVIKIYKLCGRGRGTLVRQLLVIRKGHFEEKQEVLLYLGEEWGTVHMELIIPTREQRLQNKNR